MKLKKIDDKESEELKAISQSTSTYCDCSPVNISNMATANVKPNKPTTSPCHSVPCDSDGGETTITYTPTLHTILESRKPIKASTPNDWLLRRGALLLI